MKILVTGAAGFIGSHLTERLLGLGHEVTGLDCLTDYYSRGLKEMNVEAIEARGARLVRLDLACDPLEEAVADADIVYHLAAQPGISATTPFADYERNNIVATHRLLEALAAANPGLRGFINIATSSIYGAHATDTEETAPKPTSHYGVTKLCAEQMALAHAREGGLPACSLRLFSVYGERERPEKLYPRLIQSILTGAEFPLFEGSERHSRSFTYVGDIIDGFVAALGRMEACRGEIVNIGTEAEHTTGEGIAIVERLLGRKARLKRTPPRPGDQLQTRASIAKARRLLDYNPTTTLEEGLRREVEWFQRHEPRLRAGTVSHVAPQKG